MASQPPGSVEGHALRYFATSFVSPTHPRLDKASYIASGFFSAGAHAGAYLGMVLLLAIKEGVLAWYMTVGFNPWLSYDIKKLDLSSARSFNGVRNRTRMLTGHIRFVKPSEYK